MVNPTIYGLRSSSFLWNPPMVDAEKPPAPRPVPGDDTKATKALCHKVMVASASTQRRAPSERRMTFGGAYPMTDPCMYGILMLCHLPSTNTPVMLAYIYIYTIHGSVMGMLACLMNKSWR